MTIQIWVRSGCPTDVAEWASSGLIDYRADHTFTSVLVFGNLSTHLAKQIVICKIVNFKIFWSRPFLSFYMNSNISPMIDALLARAVCFVWDLGWIFAVWWWMGGWRGDHAVSNTWIHAQDSAPSLLKRNVWDCCSIWLPLLSVCCCCIGNSPDLSHARLVVGAGSDI